MQIYAVISSTVCFPSVYIGLNKCRSQTDTVKPVCNDHLYNKIYYLWFIQ